MGIDFSADMKQEYLYVQGSGVFSVDAACDAFLKLLENVDACNAKKILIDCLQLKGKPDTLDYFIFGKFVSEQLNEPSKTGKIRRLQIAFVATEPLLDRKHLAAIVASNRGADVNSFDNLPEALEWLNTI